MRRLANEFVRSPIRFRSLEIRNIAVPIRGTITTVIIWAIMINSKGRIPEEQGDQGSDQHDRHHQQLHPGFMETRPPPQGIGQKCTPDHRIAHQGRDGGSPEAEHKNDGGGTP